MREAKYFHRVKKIRIWPYGAYLSVGKSLGRDFKEGKAVRTARAVAPLKRSVCVCVCVCVCVRARARARASYTWLQKLQYYLCLQEDGGVWVMEL